MYSTLLSRKDEPLRLTCTDHGEKDLTVASEKQAVASGFSMSSKLAEAKNSTAFQYFQSDSDSSPSLTDAESGENHNDYCVAEEPRHYGYHCPTGTYRIVSHSI